jgi:hypothetical protein
MENPLTVQELLTPEGRKKFLAQVISGCVPSVEGYNPEYPTLDQRLRALDTLEYLTEDDTDSSAQSSYDALFNMWNKSAPEATPQSLFDAARRVMEAPRSEPEPTPQSSYDALFNMWNKSAPVPTPQSLIDALQSGPDVIGAPPDLGYDF